MQDALNIGERERKKKKKKATNNSQIKKLHDVSIQGEIYIFHFRSPPITILNHALNHASMKSP